jgi:predicted N-formylglutamate amidohydrolase
MDLLLSADERPAYEVREADGPFVVVCEHASNRLPRALGSLGLGSDELKRHIAWDPGALEVAAGIAGRLGGALVTQRYSRLAIDCNRDPSLPDAITTRSEDTTIPRNADLSDAAKASRINEIWRPFHEALDRLLTARQEARRATALVTVHSFTPVYRGVSRPWHVGIISTDERALADSILKGLRREAGLVVGDNEPYSAKDNVDYTIRRHGRDRGVPHVMIEVRNDLLATAAGQEEWAVRLTRLLDAFDVSALAA